MLLPSILKYLWLSHRQSILAYTLASVALVAAFAYAGHKQTHDFNALSLLRFLNISFILCGLLMARQLIYRHYQDGSRYFFNTLPIEPLTMRLYEQTSYYLMVALPYLLTIPLLLLMVNYNGLWSNRQIFGFLGYQLFFGWVIANIALCLAMSGRLCWYLFIAICVGCNLYFRYSKDESLAFLGFLDVEKVLFKTDPLDIGIILRYGAVALISYAAAIALSYTVDRKNFIWLHRKETGLSYGLLTLFAFAALTGNFYYSAKLNAGHTKFSGLYLTQIGKTPNVFWSSSVQLSAEEQTGYSENIIRLSQDIQAFASHYRLTFPALHYRHNPDVTSVKPVKHKEHFNDDLEIEFDFSQLNIRPADLESDILIENLLFLSKGWLGKENKLLLLRGLAAQWSWRNDDKSLVQKRFQAFLTDPPHLQSYQDGEWLKIYQDKGACLFDALAERTVSEVLQTVSPEEFSDYLRNGLNLDGSWMPYHVFRSLFIISPIDEKQTEAYRMYRSPVNATENDSAPRLNEELKETFPKVFKIQYKIDNLRSEHENAQLHFYEHEHTGRQVDRHAMTNEPITSANPDVPKAQQIMLRKERFSATVSWYRKDLECRVNLPWRYVEL
ncbi:MAG: hypothetical protein IPN42_11905 [Methylococcaceae bacterium]|nr:hypothetical protein [Methylococcaceae bacterium]